LEEPVRKYWAHHSPSQPTIAAQLLGKTASGEPYNYYSNHGSGPMVLLSRGRQNTKLATTAQVFLLTLVLWAPEDTPLMIFCVSDKHSTHFCVGVIYSSCILIPGSESIK
jgi:hypothetical protein